MASSKETPSSFSGAKRQHHQRRFYVTRESQNARVQKSDSAKLSYVGMRNLTDLGHIDEQDIVSARGTIRGKKNRVRAGLANFENPKALEKLNTERGKVVIYVTSFRGVRSTFEECRYVQDLFHNLRVRVVTKDIYVYQFYHKELEERLKQRSGHVNVPQVFIGGQHVGGKTELEQLNEVGELRKILEEYPRYETANNCEVCGGFEFIPCRKCGGSKNSTANKFTREFRALRCTHCNENGMETCPECEERRRELEEELMKKMQSMALETDPTTEDDKELSLNREEAEEEGQMDEIKSVALEIDVTTEEEESNLGKDGREVEELEEARTDITGLEEHGETDFKFETENLHPEAEPDVTEQGADVAEEVGEESDKVVVQDETQREREIGERTVSDAVKGVESDSKEMNTAAALTKFICDLDAVHF